MDQKAQDEIGVLHARVEYLAFVVSELLARCSEDDVVAIATATQQHFLQRATEALNTARPDSFVREIETFPHAQLRDATLRWHDREHPEP